jgi:HEAT repeat protein
MSDVTTNDGGSRTGLWLAGGLVLLLGGLGLRSYLQEDPVVELTLEERYKRDWRLTHFSFAGCAFGRTFDADTSDMLPVLVGKLDGRGGVASLQYAKREVAAAGEAAIPHLTRLFDEVDHDAFRQGVAQNVVEVVNQMDEGWGLPILRRAMEHPEEGVLLKAVAGLRRFGEPADYDLVLGRFEMARTATTRLDLVAALVELDHDRLVDDFLKWLEWGYHGDVYKYVAPHVCTVTSPDRIASLRERASGAAIGPLVRTYLIAPSARDGDLISLEEILDRSNGPALQLAIGAIKALGLVGLGDRAAKPFRDHASHEVRLAAAEVLVGYAQEDEVARTAMLPILERGLEDPSPEVRKFVREALLRQGHEPTLAACLQDLRGHPTLRGEAIAALHKTWDVLPDAPDRALAILEAKAAEPLPLKERIGLCSAIGLVPRRAAAELLFAQEDQLPEAVGGVERYHYLCGQVFNTGEPGRALLREKLATETDPFRRLGLISFVWQDHEDVSRETLIEAFLDTDRNPFERLLVAELLIKLGPAQRVAPMIKRAYLEITHPDVRPAMQCLLWAHFGDHFED